MEGRTRKFSTMTATERPFGPHVEGAFARSLVVLVESVVGLDIVGGCGNGGILLIKGHTEKLVRGVLEREKWETKVGV